MHKYTYMCVYIYIHTHTYTYINTHTYIITYTIYTCSRIYCKTMNYICSFSSCLIFILKEEIGIWASGLLYLCQSFGAKNFNE